MSDPLELHITSDLAPLVNLALQQNHVPFFRRLEVHNTSTRQLPDVSIHVSAIPPFFAPWQTRLDSLAAGAVHQIAPVPLLLAPDFLAAQTEREAGLVEIRVEATGLAVRVVRLPVAVLSPHEWGGLAMLPELLAAFVRPNAAVLAPVLIDTAARLKTLTDDAALAGYQSREPKRVYQMVQALYEAVQAVGVTYSTAPASFESLGQKVRTHEQVLGQRLANCLDLTVLFAALLEQIGLHPLLIVQQGHAFPGVWLTDFALQEPALDDPRPIRKRVELGEALVFDSSAVAQGVAFDSARGMAEANLAHDARFLAAIDVHCARVHQIRPLPFHGDHSATTASSGVSGTVVASPGLPDERFRFGATSPTLPTPGNARVERWKAKLLDLSLRNRLLHYRPTTKTCALPGVDCGALEDLLAADKPLILEAKLAARTLEARLASGGGELSEQALTVLLRERQARGVVHTDLAPAEHAKVLTELWRQSRAAFEDSGAVLLYLTVGMLEWFETPSSQAPRRAPLVLIPVSLQRGSAGQWLLRRAEDETRVNVTLLKKLEADFGITVAGMDALHEDGSGIDIARVLHDFRRLVKDRHRWLVHEEANLGLFSFQKFLMWLDLEAKQAALLQNPVVKHLLSGSGEPFALAAELVAERDLDRTLAPDQTLHVVDADPSQASAIRAAEAGSSFVLQGPPGTGKSQTITNLIAQLLARGKTVLFVSEKLAALEVVRTRLDKVGLGPFCLEVHSKEASKAAVMQQLRAAFEVTRSRDSSGWQRHSADLAAVRAELNTYAALLDQPSPFGTSTRGVLADLFGLEASPRVALPALAIAHLTPDVVASLEAATDLLARAEQDAGGLAGHPWRAVQRDDWDPAWQRSVEAAVRELAVRAEAADQARAEVAQLLELPAQTTLAGLTAAAAVLLETPAPPAKLLDPGGFDARMATHRALVRRGQGFAERRERLRQSWQEGLWTLDVAPILGRLRQWAHAFVLLAWLMLWPLKRKLRPLAKAPLPANDRLLQDLTEAKWQQDEALALVHPEARESLGTVWQGADTDWPAAEALLQWAARFRQAMLALAEQAGTLAVGRRVQQLATDDAPLLAPGTRMQGALHQFLAAAQAYDVVRAQLCHLLHLDPTLAFGLAPTPLTLAAIAKTWLGATARLRNWCSLAVALRTSRDLGLGPLAASVEAGEFPASQLRTVLDRSLREAWWEHRLQSEPPLRTFREASHAERIARFASLDRKSLHLARQEVIARVAERAPDANAPGDEMGLLRRQLLLQRRHMPIRQLFARIPGTLRRLKPCVLMSPLSVAQYLDPSIEAFDVVVFDEASQIPPWDAVGAIARGRQVIVVGDSKQLPPTSFFDRGGDDEDDSALDDEATQDTESILDEMVAARMRELLLKWHYRSKHESLIAFSNWHYYDNRLQTFPSAAAEVAELGVKLVRVQGCYDRGGSRTNQAEAVAVVEELFALLALPDAQRPSIGVVTFSQVQQRLVEDLVDARLAKLPHMQRFFGEQANEPVFVKNLENVQGDERDVMLFSICYAPDAAGKMTMNFGPLNRKGGERRLNVAVTRARKRLMVYATLDWSQIDENKSRAMGVGHLKAFLRYAALGPTSLLAITSAPERPQFSSPFEQEVHRVLSAAGWQVHTQVGCSGYRIDLGVVDPARAGTYVLGIECDGATYHSAHVARARDRLRQDVLESLGWRIYRIWSTDWWYGREAAVGRLLAAVQEATAHAKAGPPAPVLLPPETAPAPVAAVVVEVTQAAGSAAFADRLTAGSTSWPEAAMPFVAPLFRGQAGDRDGFYAAAARTQLARSVADIVREFGPIHVDTVTRLIASQWGFGRTGKQIVDQILGSLELVTATARPRQLAGCLWPETCKPGEWRGFRYVADGQTRALDEVPHEEIANVAAWLLGRALSISHAELVRETARVLGARAVTAKTTGLIEAALPLLERSGRGAASHGKWRPM